MTRVLVAVAWADIILSAIFALPWAQILSGLILAAIITKVVWAL